jgi:GxxExxY protein
LLVTAVRLGNPAESSECDDEPILATACAVQAKLNDITDEIIGAAVRVHRVLGPGLLESSYEACTTFELLDRGLSVERQKALPLVYRGRRLDCGYRIDLLVEGLVVVEIKAIERLDRVHRAQVLSYLRLSGCKVGLLINFNVKLIVKEGLARIVNGFPED